MTQEDLVSKLIETEARSRSNTHRLNELQGVIDAVNRLATAVEVMASKQETMGQSVNRLESKVDALESTPARRWNSVIDKTIQAIVAALVGAAVAYLKMNGG